MMNTTKNTKRPIPSIDRDANGNWINVDTGERLGTFSVRVTRTVQEPLLIGYGSHSIGDVIDDYLAACAAEGDDVENVSIDLLPSEWKAIKESALAKLEEHASHAV